MSMHTPMTKRGMTTAFLESEHAPRTHLAMFHKLCYGIDAAAANANHSDLHLLRWQCWRAV